MTLFLERHGHGRPVVFLHGWGFNGSVWDQFLPELPTAWSKLVFDLPGFGRSPWTGDDYALDIVSEALADQAPPGAIWIGWSLGGLIAIKVAHRFPEKVSALVLLAANPHFTSDPDWPHGVSPTAFEEFSGLASTNPDDALSHFTGLVAQGGQEAKQVARILRDSLTRFGLPSRQALLGGLRLLADSDLRPALAQVHCPTLCILGQADGLVPASLEETLVKLSRHIQAAVIPGAAHAPFLSHPAQTARLVQEFLTHHGLG
jgi:pimeloyl-[acyl-carrier protein] methyl ester esterase